MRGFEDNPRRVDAAGCLHALAEEASGNRKAILRQVAALQRRGHARNPWLLLTEGRILALGDKPEGAEALYRAAAAEFAVAGLPAEDAARGMLTARGNLRRLLIERGALGEARLEVNRVHQAVEAAGNPAVLRARANILEAKQLANEGGDLERAARLLRAALPVNLARPHRMDLLETRGDIHLDLHQLEESRLAYEEAEQLALVSPENPGRRATALYGRARIAAEKLSLLPTSEGMRREVIELARRALSAAQRARKPDTEANARVILAQALTGQEREDLLSGCLTIGAPDRERCNCLLALARHRASQGRREEARADLARVRELMAGLGTPLFQALILSGQIEVSWMIGPDERAIEDSWKALYAVEELRRGQERGSPGQAGLFAGWAHAYYQLAGQILRTADDHPERLAAAFSVIERLHARALRDAVDLSPASPADFAKLGEAQAGLAPDEALLVFQVAPDIGWDGVFAGGSWLLAAARGTSPRLYRLPAREALRDALGRWETALAERRPNEPEIAAVLYQTLVKRALADLPPRVRRLVVIPDDHLHRLPWAALRPSADEPTLIERYEIALSPSATLWRDVRRQPPPPAGRAAALIFAAPALPKLAPLPQALREGRDVRRDLPGESLLLTGERAAESALAPGTVERFPLLHFATHSEVNERHPEKSLVHLAGGGGQDGRLTSAEIARLPLDGRLVVLSSCEGQAGRVLLGEGAMSLARAFFQARARTVVASLWKVRDDEARLLSASFYRYLAAGKSAAAAAAAAQRERARAGAPAAAWAGLVVLGDGDLAPVAPRRRRWSGPLVLLAAAVLGAVRGMRGRTFAPSLLPALLALLLAFLTPAPAGADALADCTRRFRAAPLERDAAGCFYNLAQGSEGSARAALDQVGRLVREGAADNPWLRLSEARLLAESGEPARAETLFRRVADGFAHGRLPAELAARGELAARANLARLLSGRGAFWEARFEVERARRAVVAAGNLPALRARADYLEARQLLREGGNLEEALSLLSAARTAPLEGTHRIDLFNTRGRIYLELDRLQPARTAFQEARRLAEAPPEDPLRRLTALWGQAGVEIERLALLPNAGGGTRERVIALVREVLLAARRARSANVEANARWALAQVLGGKEGEALLSGCLELDADDRERSFCLVARAALLAETGQRSRARADLARSRALADGLRQPWFQALIRSGQMEASWAIEPPERAIEESLKALDDIEALRSRQASGSEAQAGLFGSWAFPHHQLAGHLLESAGEHPERLGLAFSVLERLRARALLDAIHGPSLELPRTLEMRLQEIAVSRAAVSARQQNPRLPPSERRHAAGDLQRLEKERDRLSRLLGEARRTFAFDFAKLGEVQERLAPDEALLAFQIAPDREWARGFAGGSWLLVLTRAARPRVYRLPGREEVRTELSLWEGAIAERDPVAEPLRAARMYRLLLAEALTELPPRIRRLVVIPDDHLHRLPWAALRRDAASPPLVERYPIALTPSATLWRDQRRRPPPARPAAALIFAAPAVPGRRLEPLPAARREGRDLRRALGPDSLLLAGHRAAESALTTETLARFSLLHFAAHAEADARHPEESSVHLAAGGGQDGRLTPPEIARLDLAGRLVVLSSCEGQAGRVLLGEGTLSLARSFLGAHARTVVASLWKVRDGEARALSARFYRHLEKGQSAAAALAAAQRELARAGAPAAAWAGFTVYGDGDLVAVPVQRRGWIGPLLLLAVAALGTWRGLQGRERAAPGS